MNAITGTDHKTVIDYRTTATADIEYRSVILTVIDSGRNK